jgi:DNA-binding IclR family transcriptional regulator
MDLVKTIARRSRVGWRSAELARAVGMPPTQLRGKLKTLREKGTVEYDTEAKVWRLAQLRVRTADLSRSRPRTCAEPGCGTVVKKLGARCYLHKEG